MSSLKLGLVWYAVTLVVYGVLLYTFREYEVLSAVYHILSLFPVMLIILKRETFRDIGFRWEGFNVYVLFVMFVFVAVYLVQIFVVKAAFRLELGYAFFMLVVVAPLTEEIFYRGYLQGKFCSILKHDYLAIVIVSLLFMLAHVPRFAVGMYSLISLVFVLMNGGALGWMYKEGKSIVYPVVFHAILNFVAMTLLILN